MTATIQGLVNAVSMLVLSGIVINFNCFTHVDKLDSANKYGRIDSAFRKSFQLTVFHLI